MKREYVHLSDEELLLLADGELSSRRSSLVNEHLAACWDCRARLRKFEGTIADFVDLHHRTLDSRIPFADGPRALLSARLAEASARDGHSSWADLLQRVWAHRSLGYAAAAILIALAGVIALNHAGSRPTLAMRNSLAGPVPDRYLTPGAYRAVSANEVCSTAYSDDADLVPASVKQRVFQEYGMAGQSKNYELDYLISPQLGGTDDIRNLWPEPASASAWNLRDKDALENRLHQLVCQGKLNLTTAQRDLSTDWISAYKKYFHTDRPIEPM